LILLKLINILFKDTHEAYLVIRLMNFLLLFFVFKKKEKMSKLLGHTS